MIRRKRIYTLNGKTYPPVTTVMRKRDVPLKWKHIWVAIWMDGVTAGNCLLASHFYYLDEDAA